VGASIVSAWNAYGTLASGWRQKDVVVAGAECPVGIQNDLDPDGVASSPKIGGRQVQAPPRSRLRSSEPIMVAADPSAGEIVAIIT